MKRILLLIPLLLISGCGNANGNPDGSHTSDDSNISEEDPDAIAFYHRFELPFYGYESEGSMFDTFIKNVNSENTPFGKQILLSFIQESCSYCNEQYKYLEEFTEENYEVSFFTVFLDTLDEDGSNIFIETLFDRYSNFFRSAVDTYENSNIKDKVNIDITKNDFVTPTNFYFDFRDTAPSYTTEYGISEVYLSFDSKQTINEMITHSGIFGK